jgi:hypothetical protein
VERLFRPRETGQREETKEKKRCFGEHGGSGCFLQKG